MTSVYCPRSTNLEPPFVAEIEEEAEVVLAAARLPWVSLVPAVDREASAAALLRDLRVVGRHS